MPIKKSELYSSIWKSCDELRGGMDASQYKDYILVLLFVKYVSDKAEIDSDTLIEVPEGASFKDFVALKNKPNIGEGMNTVIAKLAEENNLYEIKNLADFDNSDKLGKGKDKIDRLSNLIGIFQNPALDFSKNRAEGDDLLGDAYEYLMQNFAKDSGKSKGQFYTPAEVSRIIAKIIGIQPDTPQDKTIYDPTCGSGSLLIKASDEAKRGLTIYGQEMDNATASLAKMNMILHNNATAKIWQDNTLSTPYYKDEFGNLQTFDFAVANPPFSTKSWTTGLTPHQDQFGRFADGVPPDKNGDYAFFQHLLRSLNRHGKGAIILPHGVLFRGNAEAVIRKNIIRKGYIKGIIGLPANLFYGTGIPACIIVVDKENAEARRGIFMIDASKGYFKDGNKNRLRHQDIHKIVDVFNKRIELEKYSRMVSFAEIESNEYNLNIPRYIDSQEAEDIQDIFAHLNGGIPKRDIDALGNYWKVFPTLKAQLFAESKQENYLNLKIQQNEIKSAIYDFLEFQTFRIEVNGVFTSWREHFTPILKGLSLSNSPKALIENISEVILSDFAKVELIDNYDIYQSLMTFWTETMQDDVYLIVSEGWMANEDLIPPDLIIKRYFSAEQANIEQLEADKENITREREELEEEFSGEGEKGYFEDCRNDKGKITKIEVSKRLKELQKEKLLTDSDFWEEMKVLDDFLKLVEREASANKRVKDAKNALDRKVADKYKTLSEDEIKVLVVDDKWMRTLENAVNAELERISQNLTQRIKTLAERYEKPLPEIAEKVEDLEIKVNQHLTKMGFSFEKSVKASSLS